ncbi:hypothetical protein J4E93_009878 [Alternaria ventricosa]|uniref:uncharacterized protein n=1 Tax=Alternaria ventricosa TaxID=1187951 RepID=UPI0020C30DF4|nr:uncharacterized protein J4E93_009878 [Alternaria ventricosa]KAI4638578.1 hypothetical protein J4E93_009878 [Alternaria ventricosa]
MVRGDWPDGRSYIYIPYGLLCSVCSAHYLRTYIPHEDKPVPTMCISKAYPLEVLRLLVQWLYTGKYEELSGPVCRLRFAYGRPDLKIRLEIARTDTMEWAVKAAIMAWLLGGELSVPGFQDHAMTRLFAALARQPEQPQLTPDLFGFVRRTSEGLGGNMASALADLTIRSWGDAAVVGQECMHAWASKINADEYFKEKFFEGSILSLEKRREKSLVAEDYFVNVRTRKSTLTIERKN